MPKRAGFVLVALGAALILSALLLLGYNTREDRQAGESAEQLVSDLQAILATAPQETEPTRSTDPTEETVSPTTLDPEMPVTYLNGYGYIGYLSIEAIQLKLPVMAEWDYQRLQYAPCRQSGSTRTDDLVIAAHNFSSHFGNLKNLTEGDEATFTDMDGLVTTYALELLETMDPNAVDTVLNSAYDLVLYTCTPGGATRVVAFFNRGEE